jgi:hypothetical protein
MTRDVGTPGAVASRFCKRCRECTRGPSGTETRVSRDEVQGPQEGCRSPRRAAKPSASETPRARNGQASADPDQGCGRSSREEREYRGGNTPGGDKAQGRREPSTLPHGRRGNGLPRKATPGRRARNRLHERGGSAMSQRQAGKAGREADPSRGRGTLRRANPKSVIGVKQSRRGYGRNKASRG